MTIAAEPFNILIHVYKCIKRKMFKTTPFNKIIIMREKIKSITNCVFVCNTCTFWHGQA